MQLLGECVTHGAPVCFSSLSWALRWRGTEGEYDGVARRLPAGDFGRTVGDVQQSFFFRIHSRSAFVLRSDRVKYVVDVVASDLEDPLPMIWNEIDLLGDCISHIHFDHSLLLFSLATNMNLELATHFSQRSEQSVREIPSFFLFPSAVHGYEVHIREIANGPVHYRVLALAPSIVSAL